MRSLSPVLVTAVLVLASPGCPADDGGGTSGAATETASTNSDEHPDSDNGTTATPSFDETTGKPSGSSDDAATIDADDTGDTDDTDNTDDTSVDECGAGFECAQTVADWIGPLAVIHSAAGSRPMCGAAFPDPMYEGVFNLPVLGHECECACEDVGCQPAYLESISMASCGGVEDMQLYIDSGCYDVVDFQTTDYVWTEAPEVIDNACAPDTRGTILDPAVFSETVVACRSNDATRASCGLTAMCVPRPTSPFEPELCIIRDGEHDCPDRTPYTERDLYYESVTDTRSCPECSCSFSGIGCTFADEILFYASDDCSGQAIGVHSPTPGCQPAGPGNATVSSLQAPGLDGSEACVPARGSNTESGDITVNGATTVCCLPR